MLGGSGNLILRWLLPIGLLFAACKSPTEPTVYSPFELRGDVISYIYDGALWAIEVESGKKQMITKTMYQPYRWSSDGKHIAMRAESKTSVDDYDIAIIRPTGQEVNRVTNAIAPVWAPDGKKMAHQVTVSLFGIGGIMQITDLDTVGGDESKQIAGINKLREIYDWSPNGRHIIYRAPALGDTSQHPGYFPAYWVDVESVETGYLWPPDSNFKSRNIRYSPDGTSIIYKGVTSPSNAVYLADANGDNQIQLFDTSTIPLCVAHLNWSPDGQNLLFSSYDSEQEQFWVYKLALSGGDPVKIVEGEWPEWVFIRD